jgi:hypothetical protein
MTFVNVDCSLLVSSARHLHMFFPVLRSEPKHIAEQYSAKCPQLKPVGCSFTNRTLFAWMTSDLHPVRCSAQR